ncbi:MAG: NAD-dependent epimerase/dehydratase family protein [Desulfomonilia bacterium]|jgi:UDP-glucose 4-epimerase
MTLESARVAVTGGAGFLGSHVVGRLLEDGNEVVVLDDFSNGKMAHLQRYGDNPSLEVIRGDITDHQDVERAFAGCDVVIHLAVLDLRQSIRQPSKVSRVITEGTLNCLECARREGIGLFVNCSSSEVYGTAVRIPMDESHPMNPETPYAAAKVAQDMYVASFGRTYGLPWSTIRPFNMYGPNSHWQGFRGELVPKMIVRAMNRRPLVVFGDGSQTRDFTYVEEAARAVVSVAGNPACQGKCINFCSGKSTSVRKIAESVCQYFGLDPDEYIINESPRPGDVLRHQGDNTRFRELVGFGPEIGIEEGIPRTAAWFESLPFAPHELLEQEVIKNWE